MVPPFFSEKNLGGEKSRERVCVRLREGEKEREKKREKGQNWAQQETL